MSNISWIDLVLRFIPEALIIILAGYAVAKKKINLKQFLISASMIAVLNFLFRSLPINAVIPMAMSGVAAVLCLKYINKIKVIHGILSTLLCYISLIVFEALNILMLGKVLGLDTNKIFMESDAFKKNLYGLPSLLLFALIVVVFYYINIRNEKKSNVNNE